MKKTNQNIDQDEMSEHYDFDYSKAKPNHYAAILAEQEGYVKLQPDIKKVFKTSEQVNDVLRAIINSFPKSGKSLMKST